MDHRSFKIELTLAFWLDFGPLDAFGTLLLNSRCILESKWTPSVLQVGSKCFQMDAKWAHRTLQNRAHSRVLARFCPCARSWNSSAELQVHPGVQVDAKWAPSGLQVLPDGRQAGSKWPLSGLKYLQNHAHSHSLARFCPSGRLWCLSAAQIACKWFPRGLKSFYVRFE